MSANINKKPVAVVTSALRLEREALPEISGVFSQIEAAFPCDLGQQRSFFHSCRAEAFRRDNPNATVQFLDTGYFALETHVEEIALAMRDFLGKCDTT